MYRAFYDYCIDEYRGTFTASFETIDECKEWIHEMWLEGDTVNFPRIEKVELVGERANWMLEGF